MKATIIAVFLCLALPAWAYNLDTIASESCHEKLTVEALLNVLQIFNSRAIPVPKDDVLQRMLKSSKVLEGDLSESDQFIVFSIVVGVRSPDTDGHSTLNLSALRRLHADPAPAGQYAHALRGPDDDYIAGDIAAVDGTIGIIEAELNEVLVDDPTAASAVGNQSIFIDHYGQVEVPVFLPAYHLGRAIHAMQDAHAHMVWNEELSHVVHVLNYIDPVNGDHKIERDGMAHSGALDDCERDDTQPMVRSATQRSTALTAAMLIAAMTGDATRLQTGLSPCPDDLSTLPPLPDNAPQDAPITLSCGWIAYNPTCRDAFEANDQAAMDMHCCTQANDYCGSKYAILAMEEPAAPYLGCEASPGSGETPWAVGLSLLLLVGLRRRGSAVGAALMLLVLVPDAYAEAPRAFASVEGHGSLLNDTPNAALLDVTFGYSVRGGYRWGRWRATLHVEQNAWLSTEYGTSLNAGAFNLGVGAEALLFDDRVRVGFVVGPSVLLYDTPLDKSGTTGVFSDLRPMGFRYAITDHIVVTFDPITFSVVAPVTSDPPLRKLERRTYVGAEFGFL